MKKRSRVEMWCILVNEGIATDEEINLVTGLNGYSEETLNSILFYRTGYRDLDQYLEYKENS